MFRKRSRFRNIRLIVSGKAINGMEKELFRHDDILFFALMFAADKPARFRRHAQVKQLSDTRALTRIVMQPVSTPRQSCSGTMLT